MWFFNIRHFFLIILCVFSFSAFTGECAKAFSFTHEGFVSSIMDVKKRAEAILGKALKEEEVKAIYHANGAYFFLAIMNTLPTNFLLKKEGEAIEFGNHLLQRVGFPKHEIQTLRENHIVGLSYNVGDSLLFRRHFVSEDIKGQNSWFMYEGRGRSMVVGRIIKKIDENSLLVEIMDHESGKARRRKIILDDTSGRIIHPRIYSDTERYPRSRTEQTVKPIFQALKFKKERLTVEEMDLGQRKQSDLPSEYDAIYAKGWREINELVEVGKSLKRLEINPNKTHIDYFAGQIGRHVNYMREGILSRKDISDEQKQEYLAKLEALESEGQLMVRKKEVTYSWWLQFNRDLARISETFPWSSGRRWGVESHFPSFIVLPTIAGEGQIGIMAMNRAFPEGIYPIGLTNKIRKVDGRTMTPRDFYEHDMLHAEVNSGLSYYTGDIRLFHSRFVKLVENLPVEKRKNVELAYFVLLHETGQNFINFQQIKHHPFYIGNILRNSIQGLVKRGLLPSVFVRSEEQVQTTVDDFIEVYDQIRN